MKATRLFAIGLLLAPGLRQPTAAQAVDPAFSLPTGLYAPGQVHALGPAQANGQRLVSGVFVRANGQDVPSLVRLNADGSLDQDFLNKVGYTQYVFRIKGLPGGQYLLGSVGGIISAGGITRTEVLRLNADGSADASFDGGTGPELPNDFGTMMDYAVQPDGKVLVVGNFESYSGVPAHSVVRLTATGEVDPTFSAGAGIAVTFNSNTQATVVAVQPNGKVLVAGDFDVFNGVPAHRLVRLNTDGSVDRSFTSPLQPSSSVEALLIQPDGAVLVEGSLALSPAGNRTFLARLLPSGTPDPTFTPPAFQNNVSFLYYDSPIAVQPDGKILAVGSFNNSAADRIIRLLPNGTPDATFRVPAGPDNAPLSLGLQPSGRILLGGLFNSLGGRETSLGQLTSSGAADAAFTTKLQVVGSVNAMARQADGQLLIGGNFTELSGQPVHRLARLSATGVLDAAHAAAVPVLPGPVNCLAVQPDGKVLAGTGQGLRRLLPSGSPDPSFGTFAATLATNALALQADGRILLGGAFNGSSGGVAYAGVVRLAADGRFDPSFALATTRLGQLSGASALLVQPDGRVVVAGSYYVPGQNFQYHVARYETTGAADASFGTAATFADKNGAYRFVNRIYALSRQPDGQLLVAGNFGTVAGAPRSGLARLTATGTLDANFAPGTAVNTVVNSLALQPNGRVLVGGKFSLGNLNNLARLLPSGQLDTSFAPTAYPDNSVNALLLQPDGALLIGGAFANVGGQVGFGVGRIIAPNVLAVAAPSVPIARTEVWPVPAHSVLHVAPDARAWPHTLELCDALGRLVRTLPVATGADLTLDVAGLPAGVYLLRVQYATGAVTRQVAVH
ncbi:T9SS type A sorting domain-containing protein [Hymenobacter sp. H14-R3]|uniref:T9SS type A sorting domain-containing protein n=1 Tax=Hymenobacter sp. H14-R3 TaxID=3046308 RepID=UPI0024BA9D46|nr:T9SS type A sorting domain-containing protein [Hymenobacter sp. H14-R3]MDJ0364762.1 T9SS type A sorting domain-containing protein [Hymenobacter sp. H14-R3]